MSNEAMDGGTPMEWWRPRPMTPDEIEAEVQALEEARDFSPYALIGDIVGIDRRPDVAEADDASMHAYYLHRYGPGYERWQDEEHEPEFWQRMARLEEARRRTRKRMGRE